MLMPDSKSLYVNRIQLKNFRCFTKQDFELESPIVLIEGANGVGKTSLLEALYYACYLRSFRTHTPRELTHFDSSHFFIKVGLKQELDQGAFDHEIQVGFSGGKRLVKVGQKTVSSYKELLNNYRIIGLTENDLELITGSPANRRLFLDHVILLTNPDYIKTLRSFRTVLSNRNALLHQHSPSRDTYEILSHQLWEISTQINYERTQIVTLFNKSVSSLMTSYFSESSWNVDLSHHSKWNGNASFKELNKKNPNLFEQECRLRRSLFGAHLDDMVIHIKDKHSRRFASRGQQKLIVLLLKIAQLQHVTLSKGSAIFLLDDFMTDFDETRAQTFLDILQGLNSQLIFTCPNRGFLYSALGERGAQVTNLTY